MKKLLIRSEVTASPLGTRAHLYTTKVVCAVCRQLKKTTVPITVIILLKKGGIDIAIYHCSIKIVSRGKGKSAVAAAAYCSGEKITNDYDGRTHDYTRKSGVVHTEILLPAHAPSEFSERSTLWNAVESVEKAKNSQLARQIEIALPNELTVQECAALARKFVQSTFVEKGMVADVCIHNPEREQPNIHAHILLTMRPFNEDGTWGDKQKKEYIYNGNGEKIYDKKKRQYKCRSVPTTDWNSKDKAEEWRTAWEVFINSALEEKNITERVDHRSFERQGKDEKPTIHMGVSATQMERKGIRTVKGDINRQIKADNAMLVALKKKFDCLDKQIAEYKQKSQEENLVAKLLKFFDNGREFAEVKGITLSNMKKSKDLKKLSVAVSFLQGNNITNMSELVEKLTTVKIIYSELRASISKRQNRMKELSELIDNYTVYRECRAVSEEYNSITNPKKKDAYGERHRAELIRFNAAKKIVEPYRNANGKFASKAWQTELDGLISQAASDRAKLSSLEDSIAIMETITYNVQHLDNYEERQEKTQQRKQSGELE